MFGEDITSISHNKLMALATCCIEGEITNYRLQLVLDKHSADITKLLKELCDSNYLISFGIGRGTKYKINVEYSKVASKVAVRLSKDALYKRIIEVCSVYTSLENIATNVNKNPSYLKNKIIPRMVEQGLLAREFPENPKHPHQRYLANI